MNKISEKGWLLLVTLFALALTTFTLSYIVTAPWHEMPELGADGGKNIYTYLYQVLYGKGVWFEGMNYPYGEHIVYTDGQPLLSVPLSYLSHRVTMSTALTIMWWMVALSYVLSIIYCFKILTRFKVAPLAAMCFAGLITVLSPQLFRISGHYALSVACILPMLFYWSLQYYYGARIKYLLYIFILGTLATFLHPYYAAVSLVWAGCYSLGYFVTRKDTLLAKLKHTLPLLLSVVAVFAVFGTVMKLTDHATDRPTTPYGILVNCTTGKDILESGASPLWAWVATHFKQTEITEGGEGRIYVGLAIIVAVFCSVAIGLRNRYVKKEKSLLVNERGFQPIWLVVAFTALLFGMGAPFTWHMEWLLDYASMLKQFRTLGRFSWIFYYVITIYGSVVIYNWYATLMAANKKIAANAVLFAALGLWSFEASGYVSRTHKRLEIGYHAYDTFVSTGQMNWEQFLHAHNFKKEDFQSTLVLPFFEVGSEKLWVGNDENISAWGIAMGIQAGIQLHLPMMDGMMSRTSWDVAFKQVKIVGGPYVAKDIIGGGYENKILLICLDMAVLSPGEKYLVEQAELIGKFQNCTIYACESKKVWYRDRGLQNPYQARRLKIGSDTCVVYKGDWVVMHFNDNATCLGLCSKGAVAYSTTQVPSIANFPVVPVVDNQLYEFSCWFKVSETDYKSPSVKVEVIDSLGNILSVKMALGKESTDNIRFSQLDSNYKSIPGTYTSWLRVNTYFNLPIKAKFVRCLLENIEEHNYEAFDELMIRPADALIITKFDKEQAYMINNHRYKSYE